MPEEAKETEAKTERKGIVQTYWRAVVSFLACLGVFFILRCVLIYFGDKQ